MLLVSILYLVIEKLLESQLKAEIIKISDIHIELPEYVIFVSKTSIISLLFLFAFSVILDERLKAVKAIQTFIKSYPKHEQVSKTTHGATIYELVGWL